MTQHPPQGTRPMGAPTTPPRPQAPFGSPPPGFSAPPPGPPGMKPPTNGKAIASLVLGIAGCCTFWFYGIGVILGIVGLVLGILANKEIKASRGTQAGGGMAIAGIVLGAIAIVVGALVLVFIGFAFSQFQACFEDPESVECKELTGEESTWAPGWSVMAAPLASFSRRRGRNRTHPRRWPPSTA